MKKYLSVIWVLALFCAFFFSGASRALAAWTEEQNIGATDVEFYAVSMVDVTHGWAVGRDSTGPPPGSTIWKYDGTTWTEEKGIVGAGVNAFYGVSMVDAENGWAVEYDTATDIGIVYRYNGVDDWTAEAITGGGNDMFFRDISMVDATNGWAVGANEETGFSIIYKYDGAGNWAAEATQAGIVFYGVSMVDANIGWAVGHDTIGHGTIYVYDGGTGTWAEETNTGETNIRFNGVSMVDETHGWAAGYDLGGSCRGVIYKYADPEEPMENGGPVWTEEMNTGGLNIEFFGIHMVDANTGWAVGFEAINGGRGTIYKYDGTNWTEETNTGGTNIRFNGVCMVDATHGWAVGYDTTNTRGTIWRRLCLAASVLRFRDEGLCFIATAAYGTPMAEEVRSLCEFRDNVLTKTAAGRDFVELYYKTSPPIADFIRNKPILKAIVRTGLKPLVWLSRIVK